MNAALLAVALSAVAAPAPDDPIKLPQGPPPLQVVARMAKGKDGVIEVTQLVAQYRTEKRTRTRNVGGTAVAEEYEVNTLSFVPQLRPLDVKAVKVYTAAGKEVDPKDVPEKFKKQTIAFLAWDGKKVDPYYLKPLKEDTLIIVAPPEPAPADRGEKPPPEPKAPPGR